MSPSRYAGSAQSEWSSMPNKLILVDVPSTAIPAFPTNTADAAVCIFARHLRPSIWKISHVGSGRKHIKWQGNFERMPSSNDSSCSVQLFEFVKAKMFPRAYSIIYFVLSLALLAVATTTTAGPTVTITVTAPASTPTSVDACDSGEAQCCASVVPV